MKALVYTGPRSMSFRDTIDPEPADDEVLIKVDAVGVCGSDMHAWHGHDERRPAPLILGHEAAGIVPAVAAQIFRRGQVQHALDVVRIQDQRSIRAHQESILRWP